MKKIRSFAGILLVLLLALLSPADALAASVVQLTPAIKASLDKTAAAADPSMKGRLTNLYAELAMLQIQYDSREEKIRVLHYSNEQALIAVRKQIKDIDGAAVSRLEAQTKSLKERYQPLFDQYSSLNRRISIAKSFKDKTLTSVLQAQGNTMKVLVQLAREEIRGQEARLKAAKELRSQKISAARKTLAGIESCQTGIRSEKSVVTALNKRLSADWTGFKSAIRKPNPAIAAESLSSLVSMFRQIAASKQKILELEQKVSKIIETTNQQIGV